ncbi:MAG: peptidylprolyl isomerase, partial [Proteobacteria bacterium]|nr:peptidylprolyl isomerase [Pseudomonadota bacterium]
RRSPQRFEAIAREQSECDSKANGGRLGQIVPGETVPEFEKALEGLEEGEIAAMPVRSRFGAHILKLDARARGETLPFDYVRDQIESYLAEQQWRRDVAAYIEQLVSRATIEGVEMSPSMGTAA